MDPLVTTAWLHDHLGEAGLVILDATDHPLDPSRDAAAEFAAGHIPGARFMDLKGLADPDSDLPSTLPSAERFAAAMSALGIAADKRIILYDDSPHRTSARAWWMLRHFGAGQVALLDGGLGKWRSEGRPLAHGIADRSSPSIFVAAEQPDLADLEVVRGSSAQIVDARSPARFSGAEADPRPGVAPGRIPGSRNLHYARLFAPDGTFLPPEQLRAAFAEAGVDPARPLIATCGSGITAAIILFAAHLLGARDTRLYDGSWSEWGARPDTPKATGTA